MRRFLVSVLAAVLAACGSSSSSSSGGGGSPLSGTVAGRTFTPTQTRAVVAGSICNLTGLGLTVGVKALEIEAAAFDPASANSSVCDDLTSAQCQYHGNSQTVRILVAKVNLPPTPTEPSLSASAEPYLVTSTLSSPTADLNGTYVAYAQALAIDPSFAGTPAVGLDNGKVFLSQVSDAGPIAGSVSLRFEEGSSVSGNFTANACGGSLDICALANTLATAILTQQSAGLCTLPAHPMP